MDTYHGRCLCKAVQFEVSGSPFDSCNCHCTDCRQAAGAPYLAWVTFKMDALRFTHGEPTWYASSEKATRGFCNRCGTQLFFKNHKFPDDVDVTTACLDEAHQLPPAVNIWVRSKLPWVQLDDKPAYPSFRGAD